MLFLLNRLILPLKVDATSVRQDTCKGPATIF